MGTLGPREVAGMASGRRYPQELRERAVRMVLEARAEDPGLSLNQAVLRIGPRVGIVPDTLRGWIRQDQINAGSSLESVLGRRRATVPVRIC